MPYIIVFGDSIACGQNDPHGGWVKKLSQEFKVDNLSIDGATTNDYVKNFPVKIDPQATIIIALGVNDSIRISLKEFQQNLIQLIKLAGKYTQKIIFVGPAPVDQFKVDPAPWAPDLSYKNNLIKKYSEAMGKIAANEKLKFVDLFNLLPIDYIQTLDDGLHPNHAGHEMIFKIIYQNL